MYKDKECKKFLNKIIKLINGINKYNIDPIVLMQIYKIDNTFEPVFIYKPINIDIYQYLNTIYSDNESYKRNIDYFDEYKKKKILKHEKDNMYYSPIMIATLTDIPLFMIDDTNLNDINIILPNKYNNLSTYSNTYFVVTELFKDFVNNKEIYSIDEEFNFYDKDGFKYDTSGFLYLNEINKEFKTDFVVNNSPKNILPISKNCNYFDEEIKHLIINLNSRVINESINDVLVNNPNVAVYDDKDEYFKNKLIELKENGEVLLSNNTNTLNIKCYEEFLKINVKKFYFSKVDKTENGINFNIVGNCLKTNDFLLYVFYKYIDLTSL